MHAVTLTAFRDELEKIASMGAHAAEIAGLGILAAPTAVKHFGGKEWSEKNKRRAELGGLATLAAPSAFEMGKSVLKKIKKGAADIWNPATGAIHATEGGSRAANFGTHVSQQAQQALKKPAFTMEHLKAGRAALAAKGITPKGFVGKAVTTLGKHGSAGPLVLGALSIFKSAA